ncbi:MAG TPA: SH3 domain-containing protein [Ktedonobacteraceae bacterium]|nr:SH3 domain-containing protein [Ktedonobacteraceae bacterium]
MLDHQASYADPIVVHAGEVVIVSAKEDRWQGRADWIWVWCTALDGKSGWVPGTYLLRDGENGRVRYDYSARELTVAAGEVVTLAVEESGWAWCTNQQAQSGWVPVANLACR